MQHFDAIVVGAGAAGIAAAREFKAAGLCCVVLEARQRVGGRAFTSDELGSGLVLDHGAQWIHGYSLRHPMAQLANSARIATDTPGTGKRGIKIHSSGAPVAEADLQAGSVAFHQLTAAVGRGAAVADAGEDLSWEAAFARAGVSLDALLGDCPSHCKAARQALMNLRIYHALENYEGARFDRWSVINGGKATCLSGPNANVGGGYGCLIAAQAAGLDVRFGRRATLVEYTPGQVVSGEPLVVVRCTSTGGCGAAEDEAFAAPRCVIALPLGVLRSGSVAFVPPAPLEKARAVNALGVALMDKVELLWEQRWWPEVVGVIDIASEDSTPTRHPWPWFVEPPGGPTTLVCFVTGAFAEEVEMMDDATVSASCTAALRRAFPEASVPQPRALHVMRWGRDPHAAGSWTYYAAGSGPEDSRALGRPMGLNGCVAFAGECVCDGSVAGLDIGTVHGAWLSGSLAACGIVARFRS
eukprot:NODE_5609_length_1753_cov_3.156827.p1 GENE.NODE_5609_length_1753_cov_3.156827~~NODE_5609_length_1753_cov_3.156827.p1  ORF type:complete len:470 (-),score=125.96 NODE_5609_length_1753_cov_3.156827:246-1655(-)